MATPTPKPAQPPPPSRSKPTKKQQEAIDYTRRRLGGVNRVFGDAKSGNIGTGKYSDTGATSYVKGQGYYRQGKLIAPDDQLVQSKPVPKQQPRPDVNVNRSGLPQSRKETFYEALERTGRSEQPQRQTFYKALEQYKAQNDTRPNYNGRTVLDSRDRNWVISETETQTSQNSRLNQGTSLQKAAGKIQDREARLNQFIEGYGLFSRDESKSAWNPFEVAKSGGRFATSAISLPVFLSGRIELAARAFGDKQGRSVLGSSIAKVPKEVVNQFDVRKPEGVFNLAASIVGVKSLVGKPIIPSVKAAPEAPSKITIKGNSEFQTIVSRRPSISEQSFFTGQRTLTGDFAKAPQNPNTIGLRQTITTGKKPFSARTQTIQSDYTIFDLGGKKATIEGFDTSGIFTGKRVVGGQQTRLQPELIVATDKTTGSKAFFSPEDIRVNEAGTFFRSEPKGRFRMSDEFDQFRVESKRTDIFNQEVKKSNPSSVEISSDMFSKGAKANYNPSSKTITQTEKYLTIDEILSGSQRPTQKIKLIESEPIKSSPQKAQTLMQSVKQDKPLDIIQRPKQSQTSNMGGRASGKLLFVPLEESIIGGKQKPILDVNIKPSFEIIRQQSTPVTPKESIRQEINQRSKSIINIKADTFSKQSPKITQAPINLVGVAQKPGKAQVPLLDTMQELTPSQTTSLLTTTKTTLGGSRVNPPEPKRPFIPKIPLTEGQSSAGKAKASVKSGSAFKARIKSKGKFKTIPSKPLTRKAAEGLLMKTADSFTERSGRVVKAKGMPTNRPDLERIADRLRGKFRQGKRDPSLLIEKTDYAIDSAGERAGIPYKASRLRKMGLIQTSKRRKKSKKIRFI